MSQKNRLGVSVQDTGNPVFDATVNVVVGTGLWNSAVLKEVHATLLELYEKEPEYRARKPTVSKTAEEWADKSRAK